MAYLKLNKKSGEYKRQSGFERMLYISLDVRDADVSDDTELASIYKDFLSNMQEFCEASKDDNLIDSYALVLTPLICDSGKLNNAPLPRDNYIVTSFCEDDAELIEKVIVKSQRSTGDESRPTLGFYIAIEVSEKNPWFEYTDDRNPKGEEYSKALLHAQMNIADCFVADWYVGKIRAFVNYEPVGYFEQFFDSKVKSKTKSMKLGPGWFKCMVTTKSSNPNQCDKFIVFMDLFASTGSDFAQYALSKKEIANLSRAYQKDPWADNE